MDLSLDLSTTEQSINNGTVHDTNSTVAPNLLGNGTDTHGHEKCVKMGFHIAFGFLIMIANGYFLGFYWKYPKMRKFISITMLIVFIASFLQGLSDLMLQPVHFPECLNSTGSMPSKGVCVTACIIANVVDEFSVYLVILLLPLLSVERFIKIRFPHKKESVTKKFVLVVIILLVILSLLIAILPMTNAYQTEPSFGKCAGEYYVENQSTIYTKGIVAAIAVVIPVVMYIQMVIIGKRTLSRGSLSERKAALIKKASITTGIISLVYISSSVPYAVFSSLKLSCSIGTLPQSYCWFRADHSIFLFLLAMQRIGYAATPIFFAMLHPKVKRQIRKNWTMCSKSVCSKGSTTSSGSATTPTDRRTSNSTKKSNNDGDLSSSSADNSQHKHIESQQ